MNKNKDRIIIGMALFSMFFGAGNVIFPPYLGMETASMWLPAFICYFIADIGLAVLAVAAMLSSETSLEAIALRIGKIPSIILISTVVLCIGPLVAIPRTAATTYEMSGAVLFPDIPQWLFSAIFFSLIFLLCMKESSVVDIVGKFLTPVLFLGLLTVIICGVINPVGEIAAEPKIANVVTTAIASGYQTMDVLGAMIFGSIIFKTAEDRGYLSWSKKRQVVGAASLIAAAALFLVYGGLAYLGATVSSVYNGRISRADLVMAIVDHLMGKTGEVIFSVVIMLACVTTAIALVSASADYFSGLLKGRISYKVLAAIICFFSGIVSCIGLEGIIAVASPILSIVYAPALTLIMMGLFSKRIKQDAVFKGAAVMAFVMSLLEYLSGFLPSLTWVKGLPFSNFGLGWVTPAIAGALIGCIFGKMKSDQNKG